MSKNRIAIFPGSFDPITLGHMDIIARSAAMFDQVVVGLAVNESKKYLLELKDRIDLTKECVKGISNVDVQRIDGLTVNHAASLGAVIVRGVRDASDFDYENRIAVANRKLNPSVETIFVVPAAEVRFISSTIVREILKSGGTVSDFVPEPAARFLSRSFG